MLVKDLMTKEACSCHPDDRLSDAARILWEHDCGCVPVVDVGLGVIGIMTDRDICMAAYKQEKPLPDIKVADAMTRNVQTCNPADPVSAAVEIMKTKHVRRLPVVDESNQLLGLLSVDDLAVEAAREEKAGPGAVTKEDVADTLASICNRRLLATKA